MWIYFLNYHSNQPFSFSQGANVKCEVVANPEFVLLFLPSSCPNPPPSLAFSQER